MNPPSDPKMTEEFFKNLPSDIIIDILSRLPVRTIINCKCVCKSWLALVETQEFAKSHLSKSVPGLAIFVSDDSDSCKIFEFEDGLDLEHHELHYNLVTEFIFPYAKLLGSLNGFLFLSNRRYGSDAFYICNPITCDYVELDCPREPRGCSLVYFGFGTSKITGQHKVVRIIHVVAVGDLEVTKSECQVYTLGSGSWRSIVLDSHLIHDSFMGEFFNGNLHWLVFSCGWISCFDLETELFSTFSAPPLLVSSETRTGPYAFGDYTPASLSALGDCLCLCDNTSRDEIVIWLMKEYGNEKSWTKEFVIRTDFGAPSGEIVHPIKVFKDGDILMAWGDYFLFYYSKKNNTTKKIKMFEPEYVINATCHTPSFLSLKSFGMENIRIFYTKWLEDDSEDDYCGPEDDYYGLEDDYYPIHD